MSGDFRPSALPIITLLSDFGLKDAYTAAMKGVIAGILPQARVVDICHLVPAQDVLRAGLIWAQAVPYFPRGTVHVAVVDPGVGSRRRVLAFEGKGCAFLAPDNGLIGHVLGRRAVRRAFEVKRRRHFLPAISSTFHGRDVFAPVAARIAAGLPLEALGPPAGPYLAQALPRPRWNRWAGRRGGKIEARGEVIHLDSFGNAITNLRLRPKLALTELKAGRVSIKGLRRTYSDVASGEPLALVGSSGYIEIAVNRGDAATALGLTVGDAVIARWRNC